MKTYYRIEAAFEVTKGFLKTERVFVKEFNTGNLLQDKINAEEFYSEGLGSIMMDESFAEEDGIELKLSPYGLSLDFIAVDPIEGEFVYCLAGYNQPEEVIAESKFIESQFLKGKDNIKLS